VFWRSTLSIVLSVFVVFNSGAAFANENLDRDGELVAALHIIAARDGGWSAKEWQELAWTVAKYTLIVGGVAGTGAALYYFKTPRAYVKKSWDQLSNMDMGGLSKFVTDHGGKVIFGSAAAYAAKYAVDRLGVMNNVSQADQLRTASTPDARVYRSHIRQFFKLTLSEQYLIARQDAAFTDDLIRLARWIEAGEPSGLRPL